MAEELFKFLLQVFAAGGIGYKAFQYFADKWLENRFKTELQGLVHAQNMEIEKLKLSLTKELDRASKLHHREFEVLPKIWAKVSDGYWTTRAFVSSVQTYPDFDRMKPKQIEEFIVDCDLLEWEKEELRSRDDKSEFYKERIYWFRMSRLDVKLREANIMFSQEGIFIEVGIKQRISSLLDLMWSSFQEEKANAEVRSHPSTRPNTQRLKSDGDKLRLELEEQIQKRLWPQDEPALPALGT